ncbi:Vacuolar protein sorting-associated protein 17 [Yamadazyma tenuis]|uniref:Vacuolar protein sorting-associated protein 17 n=1 Tax=Candida tenuis (strain ATCC 10573 / BCRC 21748 / CBS 615 / JCM 9827 / NBRC 10315 / NRRL Y-1498 / VKM Y-70) TaxID=590646 RepID=G3AXF8_CANTC|nr:uncharacterized protein CANTEDRAFT_100688 [Yamadazyma tenuis ATCC 10573]EGV66366.1 hypothetical protein CANTEDRAFT_100688 [Yamadazyma tenuis ATCC 10573]WEJ95513.1 Vacuolar protein sorting-associated protein 17 [Yamadazyma tenuis]
MASAIPYDPNEFEDNNPFAEPEVHHVTPAVQPGPQVSDEPIPEEPHSQRSTTPDQQGKLTEEELHKLLPERFSSKYKLKIALINIEKNKPGNPILKFNAEVQNLPRYRQAKYKEIRRTYQEIVKFNKYLTVSNLECFVPQIPSVQTSYPTGGEEETKQLMILWQEWFDRITRNPIIIRDEEFVYFLENDFGYSVINSNRKVSIASGLVRKTLKQLAVPYDAYEELVEFRPLIKAAYLSCQKLEKLLEKNSKMEKQHAASIGDLSQKLANLSQVEFIHPGMKNMWEKLSKIKLIEADLILIQSYNEMGTLGDGLRIFVEDFYQVKEALTNRHLIMRELVQAQQQTKIKHLHANKMKSKSALDPIKVDEALRSLEFATKAEESLTLQVKRISGEMIFEKDEVLQHTELKFHKLLKNYTLNRVDHHRKILKHLENIRLDIRIVDDKGGLSRLNRENLSNLKHNLLQSQSASGDSWSSRTFRSLSEEQDLKQKKEQEKNEAAETEGKESEIDNVVDAKNAAHLLGVATF